MKIFGRELKFNGFDIWHKGNLSPVKDSGNTPELKSGLESAKPMATGSGIIYFATDTQKIYKDTASGQWTQMGGQDLPIASSQILGGIKVGANLSISENGILSAVDSEDRSSLIVKQEIFIATEGQTLFNLTKGSYQPNTNTLSVYLYGGKQPNTILNEVSSTSFEFVTPLEKDEIVIVEYIELSSATPYPMHGNDHLTDGYDPIPLATVLSDGLMAKEDKSKLDGVEVGANKYIHPATHSASVIIESSTKRFVTDAEKSTWNAKETTSGSQAKANTALSDAKTYVDNKVKTDVPENAKFTDTVYVHPSGTNPHGTTKSDVGLGNVTNTSDMNKPVSTAQQAALDLKVNNSQVLTDVPSGAKFTDTITTVNGKTGAISKADIVALGIPESNTNTTYSEITAVEIDDGTSTTLRTITGRRIGYILDKVSTWISEITKSDIGLGNVDNVKQATKSEFDTHNTDSTRHISSVERGNWNTVGNKVDKVSGKELSTNDYTTTEKDKLSGIEVGANKYTHPSTHPYSMITGAPTSLPASGGQSTTTKHLVGDDTRSVNSPPSVYMSSGSRWAGRAGWQTEFKSRSTIGSPSSLSGTYVYLQTLTPWSDPSGGYPVQIAYGNGAPSWRVGVSNSTWSDWESFNDNGNAATVNGKTVLTDVPANAKFTDTTYTHPSSHPASMITESATKRFVSDTEKSTWNAKASTSVATTSADGLMANTDKAKLDGVQAGAQVNTVTSVAGKTGAVTVTKGDVALGSVLNYGLSTQLEAETGTSNAKYMTPLRTKQAIDKQVADKNYVTQDELGDAGFGDMVKAVYDTNNNGIVDNAEKVNGFTVGANVPNNAKFTDTIYTHPTSHPASMITESSTKRFVSDLEKIKWDDYYRGNWDTVRFTVNGDADTYYPVTLTGLHMNEATMSFLEIYRAYSWTAPGTWYTPTHKGGLNLSIDYSLAGWGGQNYELQLTLSQTYSRMVADVITALPDTCVIIVWLRGGTALYELRRQSKDVRVTVYDGVQNPLPFKHKEGTQYENIYDSKTVIEPWFNFTGIKKLLTTESKLYIGGGYRNPKNSVELYHENNKPTKVDIGLGNVDNAKQATKVEFDTHNTDGVRHITGAERTNWNAKSNLALGTTSATAYRGDLGNTAYAHSQSTHARTDATNTVNNATNGSITVNGVSEVVYTHPSSHPASMITESATKRFVSDTEKTTWNNKANASDIPNKFVHVGTSQPTNNQMGWIDTSL